MSFDLNILNPQQKEAVVNTEGPCMIIAGAGSGLYDYSRCRKRKDACINL